MIEGMRIQLPSWSATSRAGRLLLAAAAVLAVLAVGAVSVALRTPPTRLTRTIAALAPPTAALDASGCPPDAHCAVRGGLPDHILQAFHRAFPAGRLLWQSSTVNAGTDEVYQVEAAATLGPGASLLLTAQCLPGSAIREPDFEDTSADQPSDLAGNQVTLVTRRHRLVSGAPGCQLEVVLAAPQEGEAYLAGFHSLSSDPAAQVRT